jgi:molybdate transport system substrate-binding protein
MRMIQLLAGALGLLTGVLAVEVSAAEVKVLSAGAMRAVLQELAPAFETASGHKLRIEYATAGVVEQKVAADDEIDVAILRQWILGTWTAIYRSAHQEKDQVVFLFEGE